MFKRHKNWGKLLSKVSPGIKLIIILIELVPFFVLQKQLQQKQRPTAVNDSHSHTDTILRTMH